MFAGKKMKDFFEDKVSSKYSLHRLPPSDFIEPLLHHPGAKAKSINKTLALLQTHLMTNICCLAL